MKMWKKSLFAAAAVAVMAGFVGCSDDDPISGGGNGGSDAVDTLNWGGGMWYAYASNNGAKVVGFAEDETVFDVVKGDEESSLGNDVMSELVSDSKMTFALDCQELTGDYWAAVAVPVVGDPEHIEGVDGATVKEIGGAKKVFWNLSKVESIDIDGKIFGGINLKFEGVNADDAPKGCVFAIRSEDLENSANAETFDVTIPVADFSPAGWQGAPWADIEANIEALAIELDTETATYASVEINEVAFNFASNADAKEAFPFYTGTGSKVVVDGFDINQIGDGSIKSETDFTNQSELGYMLGFDIYEKLISGE